jgi:hypothetical protein
VICNLGVVGSNPTRGSEKREGRRNLHSSRFFIIFALILVLRLVQPLFKSSFV